MSRAAYIRYLNITAIVAITAWVAICFYMGWIG